MYYGLRLSITDAHFLAHAQLPVQKSILSQKYLLAFWWRSALGAAKWVRGSLTELSGVCLGLGSYKQGVPTAVAVPIDGTWQLSLTPEQDSIATASILSDSCLMTLTPLSTDSSKTFDFAVSLPERSVTFENLTGDTVSARIGSSLQESASLVSVYGKFLAVAGNDSAKWTLDPDAVVTIQPFADSLQLDLEITLVGYTPPDANSHWSYDLPTIYGQCRLKIEPTSVMANDTLVVAIDRQLDGSYEDTLLVPPIPCCVGIRGNVDGLGDEPGIDISDVIYLADYSFGNGPEPPCPEEADVDGSGSIDIADVVYLVDYSFGGGPAPVSCP